MFSSRENQGYCRFDVRFHTRVGESHWFVMFYWQNIHRLTSYSSTTDNLLDFSTQKKLSSIYRHELNVINCALISWWNIKRCLQFRRNSNLQLSFYYFCLLFGRDTIWRFPRKRVARGGKLWSPETLLYPNISNYSVFFCVREKLLLILFNTCETWSE